MHGAKHARFASLPRSVTPLGRSHPARSLMEDHVVLKLVKRVTVQQRALAHQYHHSLGSSRFSVLFYGSQQERIEQARKDMAGTGDGTSVRVCPYSFNEIRRHFPAMETNLRSTASWSFKNVDMRRTAFTPRGITGPELVLFWRGMLGGCKRGAWKFLWTVESDAAFVGDPRIFFDAFRAERADLLSTGYTLGSAPFWGRNLSTYKPLISLQRSSVNIHGNDQAPLPQILCRASGARAPLHISSTREMIRYSMRTAAQDLSVGPGHCTKSDVNEDALGPLFRITVVERLSDRLLGYLFELLLLGRFSLSETFASSACSIATWCRIADWAQGPPDEGYHPLLSPRGFRSDWFFYYPARFVDVASWCDACSCSQRKAFNHRWVHPVGELKTALAKEHPQVHARHRAMAAGANCLIHFPYCEKNRSWACHRTYNPMVQNLTQQWHIA